MKQSPNTNRWGWREKHISRGKEERGRDIIEGFNDHHHGCEDLDTCSLTTEDKLMGTTSLLQVLSQRPSVVDLNLIQNCDLPPPLKVFIGHEKPVANSLAIPASMKIVSEEEDDNTRGGSSEHEKLDLLKALHLSQTRAREAERKVKLLNQEREQLSNSFLQESLRLFAHRQWVKLLQLEVSKLRCPEQQQQVPCCGCGRGRGRADGEKGSSDDENCSLTWCMALALCLGIAFGCRYLFRGFSFPFERHRGLALDALFITRRQ